MRIDSGDGDQSLTEIHELFNRIAFTILVSNTDDHTRNHGFLQAADNRWVLSPAFDINPQPYRHKQLKTGISDLSGYEASIEAAPFFDIDADGATSRIKMMAETIKDNWRHLCREAGMNSREIGRYESAFDHPQARYALSLGKLQGTSTSHFRPPDDSVREQGSHAYADRSSDE